MSKGVIPGLLGTLTETVQHRSQRFAVNIALVAGFAKAVGHFDVATAAAASVNFSTVFALPPFLPMEPTGDTSVMMFLIQYIVSSGCDEIARDLFGSRYHLRGDDEVNTVKRALENYGAMVTSVLKDFTMALVDYAIKHMAPDMVEALGNVRDLLGEQYLKTEKWKDWIDTWGCTIDFL